jgi:hypothetical protein
MYIRKFHSFIMKLTIDSNQSVCIDSHGRVQFYHYITSSTFHVLSLSYHQFLNLDDVMNGMKYFTRLKVFPLGGDVWLHSKMSTIMELYDHKNQTFFRFYPNGWEEYKNRLHPYIYSFLRDGVRNTSSSSSYHQHDARDESESKNSSRRPLSFIRRRKQILSRTTRNGAHENGKHTAKCSSLSRRKSSNSRCSFRRRSGKNAARIRKQIEEAQGDGELSSINSINQEYGSEPDIEIDSESPEDCVQ